MGVSHPARLASLALMSLTITIGFSACAEETGSDGSPQEESGDGGDGGGDDEDTGRMSETEYDFFSSTLTEVDQEIDQFATKLQKCGVLMQALDLANASTCVGEAYDGFEDKALLAYAEADDLKEDVAKECLKVLTNYQARLDRFATYIGSLHETGANLQAEPFIRLAKRATNQTLRYAGTRDRVLAACSPQ